MSWPGELLNWGCCALDIWMLYYLLPVIAIFAGLWYFYDGNLLAGSLWSCAGIFLGWLIYFRLRIREQL
jgi:hypothetical protein